MCSWYRRAAAGHPGYRPQRRPCAGPGSFTPTPQPSRTALAGQRDKQDGRPNYLPAKLSWLRSNSEKSSSARATWARIISREIILSGGDLMDEAQEEKLVINPNRRRLFNVVQYPDARKK